MFVFNYIQRHALVFSQFPQGFESAEAEHAARVEEATRRLQAAAAQGPEVRRAGLVTGLNYSCLVHLPPPSSSSSPGAREKNIWLGGDRQTDQMRCVGTPCSPLPGSGVRTAASDLFLLPKKSLEVDALSHPGTTPSGE